MKREETYKVSWADGEDDGRCWRFFTDRGKACRFAKEVSLDGAKHIQIIGEITTTEKWRLHRYEWEHAYE